MSRNFLVAFIYVLLMGLNFPLVRYISLYFDGATNNALRFAAGGLILLGTTVSSAKYRRQYWYLWKRKKYLYKLLALCIFSTFQALFFVHGLKNTSAVTASLFGIIGLPITILMVAIFFVDERKKALRFKFFLGSTIAIIGSVVFVLTGNGSATANGNFLLGVTLLTINIFIAACSSMFIKGLAGRIHPFVLTCITNLFSSCLFALIKFIDYYQTGQATDLANAAWWHLVGISLAGLIATFLFVLYVQIIKTQGVIIFNILQLIIPIATAILSFYLLGESINFLQIASAIIVIIGCVIAVLLKDKHARSLAIPRVVAKPEAVAKVALAAANNNPVFSNDQEANLVASKVTQALSNERSLISSHTLASSKEILSQLGLEDKLMQISTPEAQLAKYTSVADIQTLAAQLQAEEIENYCKVHNITSEEWNRYTDDEQLQLLAQDGYLTPQSPDYTETVTNVEHLIENEIQAVQDIIEEQSNDFDDTTNDPHIINQLHQTDALHKLATNNNNSVNLQDISYSQEKNSSHNSSHNNSNNSSSTVTSNSSVNNEDKTSK